jgi:hypothetical protein
VIVGTARASTVMFTVRVRVRPRESVTFPVITTVPDPLIAFGVAPDWLLNVCPETVIWYAVIVDP